ncbi:MAG: hypothetical protein H0U76_28005 [Ktedonobacteraceae bacterium]|nr:hypothetical protein [Ktedonobacteraceae bacterium]
MAISKGRESGWWLHRDGGGLVLLLGEECGSDRQSLNGLGHDDDELGQTTRHAWRDDGVMVAPCVGDGRGGSFARQRDGGGISRGYEVARESISKCVDPMPRVLRRAVQRGSGRGHWRDAMGGTAPTQTQAEQDEGTETSNHQKVPLAEEVICIVTSHLSYSFRDTHAVP